jgi:hypothetical protein
MKITSEIIKNLRKIKSKTDTYSNADNFDELVIKQKDLEKSFFSGKISIDLYLKKKKVLNQVYYTSQGYLKSY